MTLAVGRQCAQRGHALSNPGSKCDMHCGGGCVLTLDSPLGCLVGGVMGGCTPPSDGLQKLTVTGYVFAAPIPLAVT